MIRASELQGKRVRRENGEVLGRVYEIRLRHSRVAALICGSRGFLQRLGGTLSGHRVSWEQVRKVTPTEIIIADKVIRKIRRQKPRRTPRRIRSRHKTAT